MGRRRRTSRWYEPGPTRERLQRKPAIPALRRGRRHLVAYIGVMGPQDGVDLAVRAAAHVVHNLRREDVSFTFMGSGDSYDQIVALCDELGLQDYVELPGRVPDDTVVDVLSTAAVGLSPDPKNPLNDVSTMNKTLEYMAFSLPVVAFDLKETRVSAGEAATYVESGDVPAYARAIVELLDDRGRRESMGEAGRIRIEQELGWPSQRDLYVGVYDTLVDRRPGLADVGGVAGTDFQPNGAQLVRTMTQLYDPPCSSRGSDMSTPLESAAAPAYALGRSISSEKPVTR